MESKPSSSNKYEESKESEAKQIDSSFDPKFDKPVLSKVADQPRDQETLNELIANDGT